MSDLFDYITLAKNADSLIYKFGDKTTVVTYEDTPAQNPIDPPTRQESRIDTRGVYLKYKLQDIDGINVLRGDQMLLLPSSITTVDFRGLIVRNDVENWKVIDIVKIKPGPKNMLWKVQVRQ